MTRPLLLHQRCKEPQDALPDPEHGAPAGAVLLGYFPALGKQGFEICGNIPYCIAAVEQNIVNGMGDGTFAPKGAVLREQAFAAISRLLK